MLLYKYINIITSGEIKPLLLVTKFCMLDILIPLVQYILSTYAGCKEISESNNVTVI